MDSGRCTHNNPQGLKPLLTDEQFQREMNFCAADVIAKRMLRAGIIAANEYDRLREMFTEKYQPVISAL